MGPYSPAYAEGFKDRMINIVFAANPYARWSDAWDDWRTGWIDADIAIWQSERKASTE